MRLEFIENNEEIELEFNYVDKQYNIKVNVHDKVSLRNVIIPAILDAGVPIHPNELKDLKIYYKTDHGIYEYNELEILPSKLGDKHIYCVKSDIDAERINRREAYRLFVGDSVEVRYKDKGNVERTFGGILRDVSIVGMCIVTTLELEMGSILETYFTAGNGFKVNLKGAIVRIQNIPNKRSKIYGVKFDTRTELLSKVIMKRQIDNKLKKSLLDVGQLN